MVSEPFSEPCLEKNAHTHNTQNWVSTDQNDTEPVEDTELLKH